MAIENEDPRYKALKALGYNPYVLYEMLGIIDEVEEKPGVDVFRYSLGNARLARNSAKRLNAQANYHRNRNGQDDQMRAALYRVGSEACRRLAATLEAMDEATSVAAETRIQIVMTMRDRARAALETYVKRLHGISRAPPASLLTDGHIDAMVAALEFSDAVLLVEPSREEFVDAILRAIHGDDFKFAGKEFVEIHSARAGKALDVIMRLMGFSAPQPQPEPEIPPHE